MDMLIELNLGQKLQGQVIGQISERLREHGGVLDKFSGRLGEAQSAIRTHASAWRIVGTVLVGSIGGVGWMLREWLGRLATLH